MSHGRPLPRVVTILALAGLLAGAALAAPAAMAEPAKKVGPEAIIIEPPPSPKLTVSISTDRASYREGDSIVISITLSQSAYVYVVDLDTAGQIRLLLPNRYERSNHLPAGTTRLPRGSYTLRISGPPGAEYLQAIASLKPVPSLEPYSQGGSAASDEAPLFSADAFPEAKEPQSLRQRIIQRIEAVVPKSEWAVAWTSFQIEGPTPPPPPRVNQPPVARFDLSPDSPMAGERMAADGTRSYDPDGSVVRWEWDFDGDRRPDAYGPHVDWVYDREGRYLVTLTVRDDRGAVGTTTRWVVARERPVVELSIDSSPDDAAVYLDGQFLGRTPLRRSVDRGTYELEVVRSGYQTWRTRITLEDIESLSLEVDLER